MREKLEINYLDLLQLIRQEEISLGLINVLMGINPDDVEMELSNNQCKVGETYSSGGARQLPVYHFRYKDCPTAAKMIQWAKVYAFAQEGSAYATHEISEYDSREENPYMQVAVYDPDRRMFVAGLRYLPLYKGVAYEKSTMNKLFKPKELLLPYFADALEFGATFVAPEIQQSTEAQHCLFSAMAFASELNAEAKYLVGRPTIPGTIIEEVKQMIAAWMWETFPPKNLKDDAYEELVEYHNIPPIEVRSFVSFVEDYNQTVEPSKKYTEDLGIRKKIGFITNLVRTRGVNFPAVVTFYTKITTDGKGLSVLGPPVINPDYLTKSWEFPILVDKSDIASVHINYLNHVKQYMK